MGCLAQIAIGVLGILLIGVGAIGIDHHLGSVAAFLAVLAAFFLRFMLPLTIGTYFAAVDVFGWPWWAGVLLAFPQLVFIIPSVVESVVAAVRGGRSRVR